MDLSTFQLDILAKLVSKLSAMPYKYVMGDNGELIFYREENGGFFKMLIISKVGESINYIDTSIDQDTALMINKTTTENILNTFCI